MFVVTLADTNLFMLFVSEARTHGTAFYEFSTDHEERSKQMEALNKIRDDTLDKQQKRLDLKKSRDDVIANRVKMAKARVRARQGLPPEEEKPVETGEGGSFSFQIDKFLIAFLFVYFVIFFSFRLFLSRRRTFRCLRLGEEKAEGRKNCEEKGGNREAARLRAQKARAALGQSQIGWRKENRSI